MPFPYSWGDTEFFKEPQQTAPYTLIAYSSDGVLQKIYPTHFSGSLRERMNQPAEMSFRIRAADEGDCQLVQGVEIWVYDQFQVHTHRMRIMYRNEESTPAGGILEITCMDLLVDLGGVAITDYSAEDTIENHLTAWLTESDVTIGDLDSGIGDLTRTVEVTSARSVLELLRDLRRTVYEDNMFWVDQTGALWWKLHPIDGEETPNVITEIFPATGENQISTYRGNIFAVDRNISSLRRQTDFSKMATTTYAYGANVDGEPLESSPVTSDWGTYAYQKQILIDKDEAGDVRGATDYALSFSVAADADLAQHALADGSDIKFLSSSSGPELTTASKVFDPNTGALSATVTIPFLSGVSSTPIYLVYKDVS